MGCCLLPHGRKKLTWLSHPLVFSLDRSRACVWIDASNSVAAWAFQEQTNLAPPAQAVYLHKHLIPSESMATEREIFEEMLL